MIMPSEVRAGGRLGVVLDGVVEAVVGWGRGESDRGGTSDVIVAT